MPKINPNQPEQVQPVKPRANLANRSNRFDGQNSNMAKSTQSNIQNSPFAVL